MYYLDMKISKNYAVINFAVIHIVGGVVNKFVSLVVEGQVVARDHVEQVPTYPICVPPQVSRQCIIGITQQ
jgi:hypothetical protein